MGEATSRCETAAIANHLSQRASWCAVQTGYRYEHRIAGDLRAKGFETYLPELMEVRQWKDRKKTIAVPAFSGYLFVRHDFTLSDRIKILETSGVVRLLGDNHKPMPVDEAEIEALRIALGSGFPCYRFDDLAIGTHVCVKRGALSGISGKLVRVKAGPRLVLAISTVSQAISVEVNLNDVEPAA